MSKHLDTYSTYSTIFDDYEPCDSYKKNSYKKKV